MKIEKNKPIPGQGTVITGCQLIGTQFDAKTVEAMIALAHAAVKNSEAIIAITRLAEHGKGIETAIKIG